MVVIGKRRLGGSNTFFFLSLHTVLVGGRGAEISPFTGAGVEE